MAVLVSPNLKTAAFSYTPQVSYHLLCDWNDDGFASQATWTDESAYIQTIEGVMEGVSWDSSLSAVGRAVSNSMRVLLDNHLAGAVRRFWLVNSNGTLYASMGDGEIKFKRAVLKVGFTYGGTTYYCPVVTGYITEAREVQSGRQIELTITDRAADCENTTVNTLVYEGHWPYTYVYALTETMSRDTLDWDEGTGWGTPYVDAGMGPTPFAWADNENLWEELSALAESQMGRVWFDREGNFHFEDGSHWVRPRSETTRDPRVSQATIGKDDYATCDPVYELGNHYSHISIEYTPRYTGALQAVYSTPEVWMVPPASSATFYAEFRHPVRVLLDPVVGEDYVITSAAGTDMTADATVTFTFAANQAKIEVANANTTRALIIAGMTIQGWPILPRQASRYETEDGSAVHKTTWKISNPFIQTYRSAQAVADFALARFAGHVSAVKLAGVRGMPWLEIGDRVTIVGDSIDTGHQDHFISRIGMKGESSGQLTMDIDAIRCDDLFPLTDYFFLGDDTTPASRYGTGTGHGHLFY